MAALNFKMQKLKRLQQEKEFFHQNKTIKHTATKIWNGNEIEKKTNRNCFLPCCVFFSLSLSLFVLFTVFVLFCFAPQGHHNSPTIWCYCNLHIPANCIFRCQLLQLNCRNAPSACGAVKWVRPPVSAWGKAFRHKEGAFYHRFLDKNTLFIFFHTGEISHGSDGELELSRRSYFGGLRAQTNQVQAADVNEITGVSIRPLLAG